jgi:hypothetical protein
MKQAGGDKVEPMETEPPAAGDTTDGDEAADSTADTTKAEAMAASNAVPMSGNAGMVATKSGKAASTNKDGGGQYSPSQPTDDWADNLRGVKQLMTTTQSAPPPIPLPPPPARKEKGEPDKGSKKKIVEDAATGGQTAVAAQGESGAPGDAEAANQSIVDRSNEFVRKKRVEDIKVRLGKDMMVYQSIRARNICETKAANLLGTVAAYALAAAGMVETGDGRLLTGGLKMALTDK